MLKKLLSSCLIIFCLNAFASADEVKGIQLKMILNRVKNLTNRDLTIKGNSLNESITNREAKVVNHEIIKESKYNGTKIDKKFIILDKQLGRQEASLSINIELNKTSNMIKVVVKLVAGRNTLETISETYPFQDLNLTLNLNLNGSEQELVEHSTISLLKK